MQFPDESLVSDFHVTEHIGTSYVTKSEYSNVTFTCKVDSNPLASITIRKENEIRRSVYPSKQLEYSIANLSCWDAGLYTCDSTPRRPPGMDIKLNFTARQHENTKLQYTVFAFPVPSPSQFVWKRCSSSIICSNLSNLSGKTEVTTSGLSSNLTILDIDKDDYGMYRISIDNGIGKVLVEEMYLQPAGPPDSPRGFKVIPNTITSTSVVLTWIPGFNNGLLQTFHISYRPSIPFADWLEMNVTHTGETEMNVTLDNLEPGESYIVNLYASNLAGESARRNITLRALTHILSVSSSRQTANGTENPGYNAAVTYEEVSMTNDKTVYDALNIGSDGSNTPHVYMSVDTSKSNAYYENVKKEDPVYNNTSLKNPVQTEL
ncbi:NPHN-like protein [Mya arenaria]|uniref:NPHN-like protein n=1 Tax=Mya arenaria TaxID=6604 RepID=A0ABY7E609_MYAAR|nr:NPHN-like protein [Mya arenaria]